MDERRLAVQDTGSHNRKFENYKVTSHVYGL
jgi:hypothetical protein